MIKTLQAIIMLITCSTATSQILLRSGVLVDCNRDRIVPATILYWPLSVAQTGTYPLISVTSNATVLTPNGAPVTENDLATHRYHHHTRISNFGGITWVAFSSGCTNEQDAGQQVGACWSTNKGVTWSAPIQIVPSMSMWTNQPNLAGSRICYPRNFTAYNGTNYLVSAVDDVVTSAGSLHGAALLACPVFTNGTIGTLTRISAATCADVDGKAVPAYDSSDLSSNLMTLSKIYGVWGGSSISQTPSEWVGFYSENGITYTEPNTFSVDGGTNNLYRIWRSSITQVNQNSSTNGGTIWSSITGTSVPNSPSETTGLRLDDARYVIVGNPQNNGSVRDPLFLAVSSAYSLLITNVSAIRQGVSGVPIYPGINKSGGAAYPGAVQVGNYLYVSYSLQKESVGFSRVLIPGLADSNND